MRNISASLTLFVVVVLIAGISGLQAEVRTQRIVSGLDQPLYVTSDPDDADRLFIVEKGGLIKVFDQASGSLLGTPFLDLSGLVSTDGEQGLLGLAFHPDYLNNRQFYVNYSDTDGNLQVSQYMASGNPNVADTASTSVINIPQNNVTHNGGWLGFSPSSTDGFLYIAVGDDHIGYDEIDDGMGGTIPTLQTRETLNGAILRVDVDGDDFASDAVNNYAIPTDNPFASNSDDTRKEIWSYGLRNPWRPSFDSDNGDLYVADVGENTREEINFQIADVMGDQGGSNYGWPHREGTVANPDAADGAPPNPSVNPLVSISHGDDAFEGRSITGGYVYRGADESIKGQYFYSDFVTGRIFSLEVDRTTDTGSVVAGSRTEWTGLIAPLDGSIDSVSSFGEDALGNLFVVDFDGEIYRIDPVAEPVTTSVYVDGLYDAVLGRDSETRGRDHWNGQLSGEMTTPPAMTREEVAHEFWVSEENIGKRVDGFYNEFLQRPSDADGRAHLVQEMLNDENLTETDIAVRMLTSIEFHRDHLSDLSFIDEVYRRTLGRVPTSTEFSNAFFALQGASEREDIVISLMDSPERAGNVVEEHYENLLGRAIDTEGRDFYGREIFFGRMDTDDVAESLLTSPEFVYGALRDANFGDDMFLAASAASQPLSLAALQSIPAAAQANLSAFAAVPEPTSLALISLGLACLAARSRRRRR